jgi:hypothetical protein
MPLFAATGSPLACIHSFQWVASTVQMRDMKPAGKTDLLSNFERAVDELRSAAVTGSLGCRGFEIIKRQ